MALLFFSLVESLQGFRDNIPAMTETLDTYTAGTSEEDFAEADLPDEIAGEEGEPAAPYGYTTDPATGEKRPKKAPGRPRKPPGAEELAQAPEIAREADRAPQRPKGRQIRPVVPPPDDKDVPMPRGGVIAKGINKMYRRTGKIIRGFEHGDEMGIGQAFIECTKADPDEPEEERELTAGEAWEQLARNNPRVRALLLKVIAGGDIGDLVMAHAPIGVALVMKPWVQRLLPVGDMVESLAEPDEDEDEGTALPGGLTAADIQDMQDLTKEQAAQVARKMAAGMGVHLSDADIERASKAAADGVPPAFRRQQPKNKSRAQRTGTGAR